MPTSFPVLNIDYKYVCVEVYKGKDISNWMQSSREQQGEIKKKKKDKWTMQGNIGKQ